VSSTQCLTRPFTLTQDTITIATLLKSKLVLWIVVCENLPVTFLKVNNKSQDITYFIIRTGWIALKLIKLLMMLTLNLSQTTLVNSLIAWSAWHPLGSSTNTITTLRANDSMRWIKSQLNRKKMFYHKHDSINLKALHLKVVIFPKSVVVAVLPSKVLIKGRPHLKLQFRNKSKKRRQKLLVARFSLSSTNWMSKNFKESATLLFNHLQKKFKTKSQLKSQHQLKMKKLRI
jgi:hypothetical protein